MCGEQVLGVCFFVAKLAKTKEAMTQKKIKQRTAPKTADVLQADALSPRGAPGETADGDVDPPPVPGHEEIARLAYSYWEARGGGGSPEDDWLRAERQLRASE